MAKPKVIELRGQNSLDVFRIDSEQDVIAWGLLIKGRSIFLVERIMELDSVSFAGCLGDLQKEADTKGPRWTMHSWQTAECFGSLMGSEREKEISDDEEEDEKHQPSEDGMLSWIDHYAFDSHVVCMIDNLAKLTVVDESLDEVDNLHISPGMTSLLVYLYCKR